MHRLLYDFDIYFPQSSVTYPGHCLFTALIILHLHLLLGCVFGLVKWKVALDTRSAWQVCTAVPADGEALFAGELEARRPGSLDAVAAYVARVDLPGRS